MKRTAGWLVMLALAACATGSATDAPRAGPLQSFEFIGCGSDWPSDRDARATVWRATSRNRVTFLVRHPGACGLEGDRPTFVLEGDRLRLAYSLARQDGAVSLCECEYWAKFTFDDSMRVPAANVTFGDWPTDPGSASTRP